MPYYIVKLGTIFRREVVNNSSSLIRYARQSRIRLTVEEAAAHGNRVELDPTPPMPEPDPNLTTAETIVNQKWPDVVKSIETIETMDELVDVFEAEVAGRRRPAIIQYLNDLFELNGMKRRDVDEMGSDSDEDDATDLTAVSDLDPDSDFATVAPPDTTPAPTVTTPTTTPVKRGRK